MAMPSVRKLGEEQVDRAVPAGKAVPVDRAVPVDTAVRGAGLVFGKVRDHEGRTPSQQPVDQECTTRDRRSATRPVQGVMVLRVPTLRALRQSPWQQLQPERRAKRLRADRKREASSASSRKAQMSAPLAVTVVTVRVAAAIADKLAETETASVESQVQVVAATVKGATTMVTTAVQVATTTAVTLVRLATTMVVMLVKTTSAAKRLVLAAAT